MHLLAFFRVIITKATIRVMQRDAPLEDAMSSLLHAQMKTI